MEWLTQNWILVAFAVIAFLFMRRGGAGCGHSGGHHGGASHDGHGGTRAADTPAEPKAPFDPGRGRHDHG